jgi:hypothetical protein
MDVKLGKLPVKQDSRNLKLTRYLIPAELPPIPPSMDWGRQGQTWPMMLNDELGCCTWATAGHMVQTWTANAGAEVIIPDSTIRAGYLKMSPGDVGCYELDVLNHWRKEGIGGHKITAFVGLDEANVDHIKAAVYLFGGVYIGLSLPLTAQEQVGKVWQVVKGPGSNPGSWGGHAVNIVGYMPDGLICITWGAEQVMTWKFWKKYTDESYGIISPDFFKSGKSPNGFDRNTLIYDLQKIKEAA